MNQENYQYVADQVKYGGGFGDSMLAEIKSNFEKGMQESSTVLVKKHGNDVAESTLNFSKSKNTDMQFWNNFSMKVRFEDGTERAQSFKVNRINKNIIKENEAYKLLTGASLVKEYKTGQDTQEKKWVVLDENGPEGQKKILTYGENHGYDIRSMLKNLPIRDKEKPGVIEGIADTMERGYKANVTYLVNGADQQVTLSAKPRYKAIDEVDAKGRKFTHQQNVIEGKVLKPEGQGQKSDKGRKEKQNDGEESSSSKEVKRGRAIKEPTVKGKKPRNAKKHGI